MRCTVDQQNERTTDKFISVSANYTNNVYPL